MNFDFVLGRLYQGREKAGLWSSNLIIADYIIHTDYRPGSLLASA